MLEETVREKDFQDDEVPDDINEPLPKNICKHRLMQTILCTIDPYNNSCVSSQTQMYMYTKAQRTMGKQTQHNCEWLRRQYSS